MLRSTQLDFRTCSDISIGVPVKCRRYLSFLFTVDSRTVIDAGVNGNEARYINHSCEPNCEAVTERRRIWIYALREIEPGEELTYDYNLTGDDDVESQAEQYSCRCGTSSCRGTMYRLTAD